MDELQELKKTLKKWENQFYSVEKHKPTKTDIADAPENIKDAYKKYKKLKTEVNAKVEEVRGNEPETKNCDNLKSESEQVPEMVETWGRQFDKKERSEQKQNIVTDTGQKSTFLKSMSNKLFENSQKFMSPKPFVGKLAKKKPEKQLVVSETEKEMCNSDHSPSDSCRNDQNVVSKPDADAVPSLCSATDKRTDNNMFQKALTLSCRKSMKFMTDDIVVPQILKTKPHLSHPSQRRSLTNLKLKAYNPEDDADIKEEAPNTALLTENVKKVDDLVKYKRARDTSDAKGEISDYSRDFHSQDADIAYLESISGERTNAETLVFDYSESKGLEIPSDSQRLSRSSRCKYNINVGEICSHQPVSPHEQDQPSTDEPDGVGSIKTAKRKRKADGTVKSKKRKVETTDGVVAVSESDATNTQVDEIEETGGISLSQPSKAKSRKPVCVTGDNFVRLNMKVKSYSRKGKKMNGQQYKRMQWKQKMKSRSKSYGDKCFKCGQTGHWANKCPGGQAGKSFAPVKEEDFPDLQDITLMASGINKADVRKTGLVGTNATPADVDMELELESGIVRNRRDVVELPPPIDPLLHTSVSGELPDTPSFIMDGLKMFGFDSFRPGQLKAVKRILCGLSTLVVLSTGGGKSLCYQLPAYLYGVRNKCITLVISPLVSLMEDQVTGLPPGVIGMCLHTNMTVSQRESVLTAVKEGKVHFLLISPEAVAGGSMSLLQSFTSSAFPRIGFVCIDEAHCLSEWSHNFRPSYLRLCKVLKERFGVRCFLGLTATATLSIATCVAKLLGIEDFESATIRGSPIPKNLLLSASRDENRDEALLGILQGDRFADCESIIIYCTRREQTERIATLVRTCMKDKKTTVTETEKKKKGGLKKYGFWDAESYHAGLTAAQRKRVQNAFMSGRLRIMAATVAFGMGLDKANVRGIIHYNMPKSFESYVQEIGRAGRDGKDSHCHLFLDSQGDDLCELKRHIHANTVDYRILKKLVQKVFPPCRCKDVHNKHKEALKDVESSRGGSGEVPVNISPVTQDCKDEYSGDDESLLEAENKMSQSEQTVAELRICPGHERALPIENTVMDLDVKEEGISTLLCYLELHHNAWLENMSHVYANCKIQCYGGPAQLQAIAKKCPPVAVAVARAKKEGKTFANTNQIDFNVVDISDSMGWDSGPVKREIKCLAWNMDTAGRPSKSGVMVEFSDLAYHFRSPGDLDVEELDDVLQFLHDRVQKQERTELSQLMFLCKSLTSVSHKNYWMCADDLDMKRNDKLKSIINNYFEKQETGSHIDDEDRDEHKVNPGMLSQLLSDIHQFHGLYGHEHSLNGRAIARVFHGISSPCFPASTWGRVRRFWRSHLNIDFNFVMKRATQELLRLR